MPSLKLSYWKELSDLVHDTRITVYEYCDITVNKIFNEEDPALVSYILRNLDFNVRNYCPQD